ncbi:serine/threonine-protein kinase LATS1 [Lingula anatina]|uniref:non-specific serine/threonine protein kinase n=1 Tax=Lingula anatina TaxID=7574 RepID=A0A1S3K2W3_LINAN|nr:serine/threonine-protein kinase LATS1 [Lingula anatina]XP_013416745.1 serine/threonine-protein kinase LATS1 [Lingula anatina]|eukprot:XP_013416744.1 serine/threonine-protein kinase LATS1 [Lingula anatina]
MIRKEAGGRRPLLSTFTGNNRQMLHEIRDSLSHLRKNQPADGGKPEPMQIKPPEAGQSTSNIADRIGVGKAGRLGYHQKALAEIRDSLKPFQNSDTASAGNSPSSSNGLDVDSVNRHMLLHLVKMGYDEDLAAKALKLCGSRNIESAIEIMLKGHDVKNGIHKNAGLVGYSNKVIRKPSFEEKYRQGSPVSDNSSIRSESPGIHNVQMNRAQFFAELPKPILQNSYAPSSVTSVSNGHTYNNGRETPPPPIPPRTHRAPPPPPPTSGSLPPPPPPKGAEFRAAQQQQQQQQLQQLHQQDIDLQSQQYAAPGHVQQMIKLMSHPTPTNMRPVQGQSNGPVTPPRGMSPMTVNRQQPVLSQQQVVELNRQFQGLNLGSSQQNNGMGAYSSGAGIKTKYTAPPPPYTSPAQPNSRQSPIPGLGQQVPGEQTLPEYNSSSSRQSYEPSSGSSTPSSGAQTPTSVSKAPQIPKPVPMQAWGAKQAPIFMQSVKSREVQKPVLQTATAPVSPSQGPTSQGSAPQGTYTTAVHTQINTNIQSEPMKGVQQSQLRKPAQQPGQLPNLQQQLQQMGLQNIPPGMELYYQRVISPETPSSTPSRSDSPIQSRTNNNHSPLSMISTISTPSTNSDVPDRPPPPYPGHTTWMQQQNQQQQAQLQKIQQIQLHQMQQQYQQQHQQQQQQQFQQQQMLQQEDSELELEESSDQSEDTASTEGKTRCMSPIPERNPDAQKKDDERRETIVRNYSPQAFKFYMEQHVENLLKSTQQRINRRVQLEREMAKVGLTEQAQCQMRRMLNQKESNYIRLKRAKMNKNMFEKLKTLGIGAFGEVALTRKRDTGQLYAMKTLRKSDVLRRNQVAHVKAERDILAEADNEWVVKLYYSFQDTDNLYFVMDYIPGGDMMSLLIKFGIFQEPLACFYIAELVLAIESVHKMGFIHRDIKPDNILIDRDGHIKLTDFGLCTGFRWTHNSKYYQKDGHARQDSMIADEAWGISGCDCDSKAEMEILKPLERRKRRDHQRCLAHSLVGTPNYIAPEVLLRSGYSSCCDWWSVGVILYEMLVGQPPFLANTPAETQMKVINWKTCLSIPKEARLSPEASDLIVMLCAGADTRLGKNGAEEIKNHPFFSSINFVNMRRQPAPYTPKIRYATDTSNFDEVEPDKLNKSGEGEAEFGYDNGKHPEHAFFEFTFRRFFDDGGHPYAVKMFDPETNSPVYV